MSSQRQEMKRLEQPPFAPGKPFVIEALGGENIYLPSQQAIMRHLVTGKDTDNAFACVGSGGIPSDPVPFHYHARMRHDFLCVKGQVKVWLNKECRVLNPGDYASVAPVSLIPWTIPILPTQTSLLCSIQFMHINLSGTIPKYLG